MKLLKHLMLARLAPLLLLNTFALASDDNEKLVSSSSRQTISLSLSAPLEEGEQRLVPFTIMPADMLGYTLSFLPIVEGIETSNVCKGWYNSLNNNTIALYTQRLSGFEIFKNAFKEPNGDINYKKLLKFLTRPQIIKLTQSSGNQSIKIKGCSLDAKTLFGNFQDKQDKDVVLIKPVFERIGDILYCLSLDLSINLSRQQQEILPTLPEYNLYLPTSISADGEVMVGRVRETSSGNYKAFIWDAKNGLRLLVSKGEKSEAKVVSANGEVVVGSVQETSKSENRAFVWDAQNGLRLLGEGKECHATAISANGKFVVGKVQDESDKRMKAFIWDKEKGMRNLKIFEDRLMSCAEAVSADGKIVMGNGFNEIEQHKIFLWEEGKGIIKNLDVRAGGSRYFSENGKRLISSYEKFSIYDFGGELQTVEEIFGKKYSRFLEDTKILGGNKEGTIIVGEFLKNNQPFYALIPFPHILKTEGFKMGS